MRGQPRECGCGRCRWDVLRLGCPEGLECPEGLGCPEAAAVLEAVTEAKAEAEAVVEVAWVLVPMAEAASSAEKFWSALEAAAATAAAAAAAMSAWERGLAGGTRPPEEAPRYRPPVGRCRLTLRNQR